MSLNCPDCGESGFDFEGLTYYQNIELSIHTCWECGMTFGVQDGEVTE